MPLTASVPATSANLGSGFDCFGLALDLVNEVQVDAEGEPGITWVGEGEGELPTDGTDMLSRAMAFVAHEAGLPLPPVAITSVNRIPLERGLGSSAAAVVAGVSLAARVLELDLARDRDAIFQVASRIEGHPDNVAAAVFGGFTLAASDGPVVRLDPDAALRPVLLIPKQIRLSTREARIALPSLIPRPDAVYNVSHAAIAVVAMTQRPELLGRALRDRVHQDARLALVPEVQEVFEHLAADGIPVCVSGAGPSLLAFESEHGPIRDLGEDWRLIRVAIRSAGAEVVEG